MIIYDLACICGCQFEGWFNDHDDFTTRQQDGLLQCPSCGDIRVRKILSPVAVHRGNGIISTPPDSDSIDQPANQPEDDSAAMQMLRLAQDYVRRNFEDVGSNLAKTSLKMLYGIEEKRGIRGVATAAEREMLSKEGIELLAIPMPPGKDDILN